jgi:poly-gamma-glutamate synthesis protein (capsule biosynthesis protein)
MNASVESALVAHRAAATEIQTASTRQEPGTLRFFGDVMLTRTVGTQIDFHGDPHYPFLAISSTIQKADIAFANLEDPISSRGVDQKNTIPLRANPKVAEGLRYAGFDVLSVANNHIWDWGSDALQDTLDLVHQVGIATIGAGHNEDEANAPFITTVHGTKIAYLGYTPFFSGNFEAHGDAPGTSHFDVAKIKQTIQALRSQVDVIVVSLHWGDEFHAHANDFQRTTAHALVDAGADLIIGHHPHVIEEVEQYKKGWIAYSLGNFVFDQVNATSTSEGLLVEAKVKDGALLSVTTKRIVISPMLQPSIQY